MDDLFGQSRKLVQDEVSFWQAQLADAARKHLADGERLVAQARTQAQSAADEGLSLVFTAARRFSDLAARQVELAREALTPRDAA